MRMVWALVAGAVTSMAVCTAAADEGQWAAWVALPDGLPADIAEAYRQAAEANILAALNPAVFPGYWSVCADGKDFGYGNTYPSLDGHQMSEALLWLGQSATVKANWDYVRTFQRPNGQLPLAILPASRGAEIGPVPAPVDANGGLYRHWVPGDPLRALASPTYIQNADAIFRFTQDQEWLRQQLHSVNLAADYLATLTTAAGAVMGAGYYVERPTRVEYDGVAQCHAVDAFRRVAALNRVAGDDAAAARYGGLADRVEEHFRSRFWLGDRFAEYIHPERGAITAHGLTDVDWAAIATGVATEAQCAVLWPRLRDNPRFYYGGMPTGIAEFPQAYEKWESTYGDTMDLAAMGRVWYLEAGARARLGDGEGLLRSLRRVCEVGRASGWHWRERYNEGGGYGAQKYCEYPANLIRIVQRYLLGVDLRLDGTLVLAPTLPPELWRQGLGQSLSWRQGRLQYRFERDRISGTYSGNGQRLAVRLPGGSADALAWASLAGRVASVERADGLLYVSLPAAPAETPCRFELVQAARVPPRPASASLTLAELASRSTIGVAVHEVSDYAPGHYTGALTPSPPHADLNPRRALVVSWQDQPQRLIFSHEASYCPLLELPNGAAMCNQFFEGNLGDAELFNDLGRKERNSFVEVLQNGPERVWLRWTYLCVNLQDDTQPRLRGTEDYLAHPNGLTLRRLSYESLMPDAVVGYSTQPVELFGVAPAGALIRDLFPRDPEQGDYQTHTVLDLYADRRYDLYWDEKGGVRRRGDDPTLAAISRSPGCALVLPFREGLLFAVLGEASGFASGRNQLVDHCTPGAEGGVGWGTGLWDHWPIGWLNSQTSFWKPGSPYAYSFGSVGQFFVPDGKRIRSFAHDYPELCKDMELNRWTERRVFHVLLGAARDEDAVRRTGRGWLDLGPDCTRPECVAALPCPAVIR